MTAQGLPGGRACIARLQLVSGGVSILAVGLISIYLYALLDLTAAQWRGFAVIVAALFPVLFVAQAMVGRRMWRPLRDYLDREADAEATPADLCAGFAAAVNLPIEMSRWSLLWWGGGGILTAVLMRATFDTLSALSAGIFVLASVSGGFVMTVFHYFIVKRDLRPVRDAIAARLDDPESRGQLIRPVSLGAKLMVSVMGVMVAVVVFAVLLSQVHSGRRVEAQMLRIQGRFLERIAASLGSDPNRALGEAVALGRTLGVIEFIGLLDPGAERVVGGDLAALLEPEREMIRARPALGDSLDFESPNVVSWRRLDDARILVAMASWHDAAGASQAPLITALLVAGSALIAFGLAWLLHRDISGATDALHAEAVRLASGDLRRGRIFESEDELGGVARSFDSMAASLRTIVSEVAAAADRVESTAGEIDAVSASITTVSRDQKLGIEQAAVAMDAINRQVHGIAQSSEALSGSVDESSSSILQLGAAGRDLNDTAGALSSRVDEVSSAIEQMIVSVDRVAGSTSSLAAASQETSVSMSEMADSMRVVDRIAEQTARLSSQVVESAEIGREKVAQTIRGMDAIRAATDAAERVIRSLGGRTREIGAIVDVIDDVAEETNLLALNAAIIAAQAGDQGRAFSVVADEIKDLADRVLVSTREIGSLIHAVQEEANQAIGAVETGARSVESGVVLSAEAGRSLEAITQASRDSGGQIQDIVDGVRAQVDAASAVMRQMDRVRGGVESIRGATAEQERGHAVMSSSAMTMREVARQVRGTTEEQARGSGRIRESIEQVRDAVDRINRALQQQTDSCRTAVERLGDVVSHTQANEASAQEMYTSTKGLLHQSAGLRESIRRFRI